MKHTPLHVRFCQAEAFHGAADLLCAQKAEEAIGAPRLEDTLCWALAEVLGVSRKVR